LGHLCRCCGGGVFLQLRDTILSGIQSNLERDSSISDFHGSSTSEAYGTSSTEDRVFSPSTADHGTSTRTAGVSNTEGSRKQRSTGSSGDMKEKRGSYGEVERVSDHPLPILTHLLFGNGCMTSIHTEQKSGNFKLHSHKVGGVSGSFENSLPDDFQREAYSQASLLTMIVLVLRKGSIHSSC